MIYWNKKFFSNKINLIKNEHYLYIQMGYGNFVLESQSPRLCYSTEENNERQNEHYHNTDNSDDEKKIPKWFYLNLPYCDECEKYIEFVDNKCCNHRSQRTLVTCNYCQNSFKTFKNRQVKCSSCFRLIQRKLKTYTFDKLKKLDGV